MAGAVDAFWRPRGERKSHVRSDRWAATADDVVLALPLQSAVKVFHDERLGAIAARAVPAKAACLDLVVSSLPHPKTPILLGVDDALYASVHHRREGQVVLQLASYLAPGESGADALPGLEKLADAFQPGWRSVLLERRFMPELVVASRDVFDLSVAETAVALELSESNVKTTHHRARSELETYESTRVAPTAENQARTQAALEAFFAALMTFEHRKHQEPPRATAGALLDADGRIAVLISTLADRKLTHVSFDPGV